jgi:hypothetical protein
MKKSIKTSTHDIKVYKYWVNEIKKELRVAKIYGWSINEIKHAGDNLKKYRLKIKQLEAETIA